MKIAIIGAGFTGLTSALKLAEKGHEVTVFEKEASVGGLASGFKEKSWNWYLDKTYHHLFTNDSSAINLAKEVNQRLIIKRPETAVLVDNLMAPFDSPITLLKFSKLPITDRLRVGICTFYLKYMSAPNHFEKQFALSWLKKFMGKKATDLIWDPLFEGKFGNQKQTVSLTWFWARIKKRTPALIYPEGGFQQFAEKISQEINKFGGKINLNTEIANIETTSNSVILSETKNLKINRSFANAQDDMVFDKVIVTLPTPIFTKVANLPEKYKNKLNSIPHLSALNLILILKKPFFNNGTYWLNITDKSFPFLVLSEHTNFMDKKYYGNQHILYIGCYLPTTHPYLKMSAKQLLEKFEPYLKKLSAKYEILNTKKFIFPNAQPIVTPDYKKKIPEFKTPLKDVYLANLDMVYPWDRGVNYAIKLGEDIADEIFKRIR